MFYFNLRRTTNFNPLVPNDGNIHQTYHNLAYTWQKGVLCFKIHSGTKGKRALVHFISTGLKTWQFAENSGQNQLISKQSWIWSPFQNKIKLSLSWCLLWQMCTTHKVHLKPNTLHAYRPSQPGGLPVVLLPWVVKGSAYNRTQRLALHIKRFVKFEFSPIIFKEPFQMFWKK